MLMNNNNSIIKYQFLIMKKVGEDTGSHKITEVKARNLESAIKQVQARFPSDKYDIQSYKDSNGIVHHY